MNHIRSAIITGANAGLGLECARQLAQRGVEKIYLACRNQTKALEAKKRLESEFRQTKFEIVLLDMSQSDSVRAAVAELDEPIDAVVLNAGGTGGTSPHSLTTDGVTQIFAVNVLGNAVLVDEMLKRNLISSVVLYAGSEAARGIPRMGIRRPDLESSSVEEFTSIANGAKFAPSTDPLAVYAAIKLTATYWMGSMSRLHPRVRFVTISPGGTTGTNGMDDLPFFKRLIFKHIGGRVMPLLGMMHHVEVGAKRYVDALFDDKFESGHFYASASGFPTGPVIDQSLKFDGFYETDVEDNAGKAVNQFFQHLPTPPFEVNDGTRSEPHTLGRSTQLKEAV